MKRPAAGRQGETAALLFTSPALIPLYEGIQPAICRALLHIINHFYHCNCLIAAAAFSSATLPWG